MVINRLGISDLGAVGSGIALHETKVLISSECAVVAPLLLHMQILMKWLKLNRTRKGKIENLKKVGC